MDDFETWPARLNPPQRNNFFFGKMMGVAQFEREQRYDMGQRWLVNRLTIGTGVLCGLEVTLTADGKRLRVAPGVAVDPWGREIVAIQPRDYDPFAAGGGCGCGDSVPIAEAKDYMLCLTYRECTTNDQPVQYADDCPGQPNCQPDTTVETYGLGLSAIETPKPFDCGAWTAAVPAATGTPGRLIDLGDLGRPEVLAPPAVPPIGDVTPTPVRPVAASTSSPPSIDVLRARLAEQLGASCRAPATTCVPLALVTAKRAEDAWSLTIANGPRRRIYTQAQMLEMILCLAKCCGRDHDEVETPPPAKAFQVTGVEVGTANLAGGVVVLDPVSPTTNAAGLPQFAVLPAEGAAASGRIVIRITFSGKLAQDSVVLPTTITAARSVWLTMSDNTATPPEVTVSILAVVPDSLSAESSTLLLFVGGPAGAAAGMEVRALLTGSAGGGATPGDYTLSLFGTDDAGAQRAAIRTDGSAAPDQILDGEYTGKFPSGDTHPGGDFVFRFELSRQTP